MKKEFGPLGIVLFLTIGAGPPLWSDGIGQSNGQIISRDAANDLGCAGLRSQTLKEALLQRASYVVRNAGLFFGDDRYLLDGARCVCYFFGLSAGPGAGPGKGTAFPGKSETYGA